MGCAASTDGAGQRRRGRREAEPKQDQTPAGDGRRRGVRKVVPEPEEGGEPTQELPSSPSFRFYCEKAAKIDAIVAATDANADAGAGASASDASGRATDTPFAIIPHRSTGSAESKEAKGWLKFRDMGIVAAVYSLFGRHRTAGSTPPPARSSAASPPAVP